MEFPTTEKSSFGKISMIEYDVCIVGSGLTGLLVAKHALEAGKSVIMLERGSEYMPDEFDRRTWWKEETRIAQEDADGFLHYKNEFDGSDEIFDDLVEIEGVGHPWVFQYNMWYGVGGSSQMWSGMAWRLIPEDFSTKSSFGYGTDWPISYEDISNFYDQAEKILEISGPSAESTKSYNYWPWDNNFSYSEFPLSYLDKAFQHAIGNLGEIVPQPHAVRNLPADGGGCVGAKTCVSHCPTKAIFKGNERILPDIVFNDNFVLETGACVTRMHWDDEKITSIEAVRADGSETIEVKAGLFYLCGNAIENIRLIKHSENLNSKKFGKASDLVGKYFSSHGAITYTVTMEDPVYPVRGRPTHGSVIEWINRKNMEKATGITMEIWNNDFINGYHPMETFRKKVEEGHWGDTLFRRLDEFENRFCISMIFETEMTKEKVVTLSGSRVDKFGIPIARTDISPNSIDDKAIKKIQDIAKKISRKPGVVSVERNGRGINGNHPLGGLRMGEDASTSVVDSWCRSHDFENLYILGGGAFCSTGSLNPTLTITALALRSLNDPRLGFYDG